MEQAKIETLNKQNIKDVRAEMQRALDPIAKHYGIKIAIGHASYTSESASYKLEIATLDKNGLAGNSPAAEFKRHCILYGLKPEHLGAEISYLGKRFKITGLSVASRTYPIIAKNLRTGKEFKLPIEAIADLTKNT